MEKGREESIPANMLFQVLPIVLNAEIFIGELLGTTEGKSTPFGDAV